MKIANEYNHLNGKEFIMYHHKDLWDEIETAIKTVKAGDFLKISKDATKQNKVIYAQKGINSALKEVLNNCGWRELTTHYFVTDDVSTAKEIAKMKDKQEQKSHIVSKGHNAFRTNNQVDFLKNRIAVEVQFGKYFSVAYDLHVKHTFFYLMDDIDVGIEIIPTHKFMRLMDTGVPWFENEVANVIREGRNNPSVPIVIIGIEPDEDDLLPDALPAPSDTVDGY